MSKQGLLPAEMVIARNSQGVPSRKEGGVRGSFLLSVKAGFRN